MTGIHAVLLPTGKVLYFSYGEETTGSPRSGTPPPTPAIAFTPRGGAFAAREHLVRRTDAPRRRPRARRGREHPEYRRQLPRPRHDLPLRPLDRDLDPAGEDAGGALVPDRDAAAQQSGGDHQRAKARRLGTSNPDVEVFTPNPDPTKVGTITYVGEKPWNLYPRQNAAKDGRVLVSGPGAADTGLLNPANWTWSSVPRLADDHVYGGAVLLPSGPDGSRAR